MVLLTNAFASRELESRDREPTEGAKQKEPTVLLPLEVMVKPLELRFKYRFEVKGPANRLEKVRSSLWHFVFFAFLTCPA